MKRKIAFYCCTFALLTFLNGSSSQETELFITPEVHEVAKFVGDPYVVSCTSPDNLPMIWVDNKNRKIQTYNESRTYVTKSDFGLILSLNFIRLQDSGVYVCLTRQNRVGFNLTVVRPILFDTSNAVQTAQEGFPYELKCSAKGHASSPKISWRIDNESPSGRFTQLENGNLNIALVQETDSRRKFECWAKEESPVLPDIRNMKIKLQVQRKPSIRGQPYIVKSGVQGEYKHLYCSAFAEPAAKFEWYFGDNDLTNSSEVEISNPQENVSILKIYLSNTQVFGNYTCTVANYLGNAEKIFSVEPGVQKHNKKHNELDSSDGTVKEEIDYEAEINKILEAEFVVQTTTKSIEE